MLQLKDAAFKLMQEIDERVEMGGVKLVGMSTGFHKLDEATGGFRKKGLYILGGRTGFGKTALAVTIGMNVAMKQKHVYYGSFEMSAQLLALRILSGMTEIHSSTIERGLLTKEQYARVQAAYDTLDQYSFHIEDNRTNSQTFAKKLAQAQQDLGGLDLAIADYLSLFTDPGDSEVQRLEGVVGRVSASTNDLNISSIGVVQLNRAVETQEDNVPTMANIRYSDRIGQDAFAAFFVHRPHIYEMRAGADPLDKEEAVIVLDKNRQGPIGKLSCYFYPKQMRWEDLEPVPEDPPPTNVKPVATLGGKNESRRSS